MAGTGFRFPDGRHCRQFSRGRLRLGTLMRHFLAFGPVTALAFGMRPTSSMAGLVALSRFPHRAAPGHLGATSGAIALPTITVAADEHRLAAARAEIASSRFHGASGPMGLDEHVSSCKTDLGNALSSRVWGAASGRLGGLSDVAPVSHRPDKFYSISPAGATNPLPLHHPLDIQQGKRIAIILRSPPKYAASRPPLTAHCVLSVWLRQWVSRNRQAPAKARAAKPAEAASPLR